MSLNSVRSAIVAKIETVPNVGVVHGFQRYTKSTRDLKEFYAYQGGVRGWYVSRTRTAETVDTCTSNKEAVTWSIVGYMSFNDEQQSEIAFDTLIEAIRAAFRTTETLGGVVDGIDYQGRAGLQLDAQEPVMFAGVLCHMAQGTLTTTGAVDITTTPEDVFAHMHADWDVAPFGGVQPPLPTESADMRSDQSIETEED